MGKTKSMPYTILIRYASGIMRWFKDDIKAADLNTRKLLTMNGPHQVQYPKN